MIDPKSGSRSSSRTLRHIAPDPRLCPRVMVHVDVPKGCALTSPHFDKAKCVSDYFRARSPNLSPLDLEMMMLAKKSIHELVNSPKVNGNSPFRYSTERNSNSHKVGGAYYTSRHGDSSVFHGINYSNNSSVCESSDTAFESSDDGGRSKGNVPTQQLTAYVAWVNSQLKKKSGAHLVEDLRHDVRDGVALVDLVEVIGGETLEGVHPAPSTYAEMRDNVDKVLQFMTDKHIKMHHITTRDIVEGNLKAIMRLILALAAHYKPNSVRHSSQTNRQNNITGIAQGAAAALTEARRTANKAGHRYRRRRQKEEQQQPPENQSCSDSDYTYSSSAPHHHHHHHHHHRNSYPATYSKNFRAEHGFTRSTSMSSSVPTARHSMPQRAVGEGEEGADGGRGDLEGASGSSSPVNSITSPRVSLYMSDPPSSMEGLLASSGALMSASCESDSLTDSGFTEVCHSLKETHEMLFQLHSVLLYGEEGRENGAASQTCVEGSNVKEKMTVLKEKLHHVEEVAESLRLELNKSRKDCMALQATKLGLEQRLTEQETQLSTAKAELLKSELDSQHMKVEMELVKKQLEEKEQLLTDVKVSYVKQEDDKDKVMSDLRREVMKRDQSIEMLQEKLNSHEKSGGGKPSVPSTSVENGDSAKEPASTSLIPTTRPGKLDMYVRRVISSRPKHLSELEAVRDSLRSAKTSTARRDMTLTLDSLEANIVGLMEKLTTGQGIGNRVHTEVAKEQRPWQQNRSSPPMKIETGTTARTNRGGSVGGGRGKTAQQAPPTRRQESLTTGRQNDAASKGGRINGQVKAGRSLIPLPHASRVKTPSPNTTTDHPNHNTNNQQQVQQQQQQQPQPQTQVLYYMEQMDKPFTCCIHKKLGEITLRDFKSLLEDSNLYHYFFKALDPEYGTVKEELCNDDDILPGWEGKIVAWLEEEGTVC